MSQKERSGAGNAASAKSYHAVRLTRCRHSPVHAGSANTLLSILSSSGDGAEENEKNSVKAVLVDLRYFRFIPFNFTLYDYLKGSFLIKTFSEV